MEDDNNKTGTGQILDGVTDPVIQARINDIQIVRAWGFKQCAAGLASLLVKDHPACKPCRHLMGQVTAEYLREEEAAKEQTPKHTPK